MTSAPRIETERLTLRAHRIDDFAEACAMWADPAVTRFIGGTPSTEQQTWSRMTNYAGHWVLLEFGYWAVEEKSSGRFVGEVGFADFKREVPPSMRDTPELGWAFASAVHGKGYGTEAVGAAVAWGDAHFPLPRTVCMIDDGNLASIRVAAKCGYRPFETTTFKAKPIVFYQRFAGGGEPADI